MGREARANVETTSATFAADESLPRTLRFCLTHPAIGALFIVLWFPVKLTVDALLGAYEAGKMSAREGWIAFGIFVALARGKDVR